MKQLVYPGAGINGGLTGPYDFGTEYSGTPTAGIATTKRMVGLLSELKPYLSSWASEGYMVSLTRDGDSPLYTLSGQISGDPDNPDDPNAQENLPVNTYELLDNQLLQDTFLCPALDLTDAAKQRIIEGERKTSPTTTTSAQINAEAALIEAAYPGGIAAAVFKDRVVLNLRTFHQFHYVLRRTISCTRQSDVMTSFTGIKQTWTTAALAAFEDVPDDIFFSLDALELAEPGGRWLKTPPNVLAAAGSRTQITYEYWHAAEWDSKYYAQYTP